MLVRVGLCITTERISNFTVVFVGVMEVFAPGSGAHVRLLMDLRRTKEEIEQKKIRINALSVQYMRNNNAKVNGDVTPPFSLKQGHNFSVGVEDESTGGSQSKWPNSKHDELLLVCGLIL